MIARTRAMMFVLASSLAAATGLVAQTPQPAAPAGAASTAPLTQVIPVDAQITTGRFANGLQYYVKSNKKPEKRAELRLVVNAGSILEEDDQQGLAHFVEHMAFNGTKHFPKMEIVNFMQSIGMRFGAHVNAYTSFDETVFQLQVPTDRPDVLDKAFLILEDWAHNVTFDPTEIDKERGVVAEEWRLGLGAGTRIRDKQFPVLLKGSRYATRLPIGKIDIIQNFKPERLTKFYADWYRPDLMAVVAVGDFDRAAVETLIKNHFSAIPKAATPRVRPSYGVPAQPGTLYAISTDKEQATTFVQVYTKFAARDQKTIGAYRQQIVEGLYGGMLSARFSEMAQKPDAPFLGAAAGRGRLVRTEEASILTAGVREDSVERGLDALFTETARVAEFGFTPTELARQKTNLLRNVEREVTEKENRDSGSFADEYIRNFTESEPIPGIVYEQALYQRFMPEITVGEINALAKSWAPDKDRVVLVSAPQKEGLTMPSEGQLAAIMAAAGKKTLTAYVDTAADTAPLVESTPAAGSVTNSSTNEAFGVTEWTLSNSVRVILKPTNFKEDEVVFRGIALGGTSLASDADWVPAMTASQVVASGGLGKLSAVDLRKALTGKVASVRPFIQESDEGVSGSGSRKDLETLFQLIYLNFTAPRSDPAIFNVITTQTKTVLTNQAASPDFAFGQALNSALYQDHPRRRLMTPALVDSMNLDKSFAFYKDRFADASGFTFTFVGSFDLATMKPLVEKYLATLPATHRQETWKDVGVHPPTGVVIRRVEKGIEPKSQTEIVFTGPFQYNQTQRIVIRAMAEVLQNRLREVLREDLGGTYSVSVSASYSKIPREEFEVDIAFGCDPARTDDLVKTVFQQIAILQNTPPSDTQVSDVKETMLRDYETSSKQNGFWLTNISLRYEYGEDLASLFNLNDYYNKLTPAVIQDAAKTYLDIKNYVNVSLFPEKKIASAWLSLLPRAAGF
jgi:zinc protease